MARKGETYDSYQRDAFDNPPRGPVGVHRGPRSVGARVRPFVIVVLVAALCGFGAWAWMSGEYKAFFGISSSPSTSETASSNDSSSDSTKDSATDSTAGDSTDSKKSDQSSDSTDSSNSSNQSTDGTDQSSQTNDQANNAQDTAVVNKATQVRVINATGVTGYAGQKADVLQTAGYTSVEASNPTGSTLPATTVVWYQNEADKATAEDVASTLGIATVEQAQGLDVPITVVLLN
ncbi:LytR C-terminal domain-containing protein [Bifidobacterium scaligerum]|uniref:Cell wall integrity and stress response protein 1 n=1 Tax=Bifidobacterium scaligerum TaxID=2052656 RepID=A0A2M9HR52_9BIFI|nr:LytR C-terminal domain-containing protein [Bifidobacterium scaligerum]PJM79249.1 cell wall integrity and stress response protein 1 [Bifidobacterium scaligerum]